MDNRPARLGRDHAKGNVHRVIVPDVTVMIRGIFLARRGFTSPPASHYVRVKTGHTGSGAAFLANRKENVTFAS